MTRVVPMSAFKKMLMTVMALDRDLNFRGYGVDHQWSLTNEEYFVAEQKLRTRLLESAEDGFARAYIWLLPKRKNKTVNRRHTSYGWKHFVEKDVGYISNGEFIAAALAAGFTVQRIRGGEPNAFVNVPERYWDYFAVDGYGNRLTNKGWKPPMTNPVAIIAREFVNGTPCPHAGQYLEDFDFDADDGKGYGEFTPDITKAKRFGDTIEALDFWRSVSQVKPLRDDGEPNRPLTALTVEIVRVPT